VLGRLSTAPTPSLTACCQTWAYRLAAISLFSSSLNGGSLQPVG